MIAAEDTRNTMKLLQVFDIHTRMIAHHSHNERESAKGLLNLLEQGQSVAVVFDAAYSVTLRLARGRLTVSASAPRRTRTARHGTLPLRERP